MRYMIAAPMPKKTRMLTGEKAMLGAMNGSAMLSGYEEASRADDEPHLVCKSSRPS